MTLQAAITAAEIEAKKNKVDIAVVKELSGEYGYCPSAAVSMLFPHSTLVATVKYNKKR